MSAGAEKKTKGGKGKWILLAGLGLVVVLAGGGAAAWMLMGEPADPAAATEAATAPLAPPTYIALDPPFIVNLADPGGARYLQANVQLMTRDASLVAAVSTHEPLIRNRLLLLLGQQSTDRLVSREDKERLQAEALAEVDAVLTEAVGHGGIEALYFTSFVTQ